MKLCLEKHSYAEPNHVDCRQPSGAEAESRAPSASERLRVETSGRARETVIRFTIAVAVCVCVEFEFLTWTRFKTIKVDKSKYVVESI